MTTSTVPVREIGLIGLTATAVYALLAMISYSPADPSFTFSGSGGDVRNLVGHSGAWFSDVALYLFGLVAYVVPIALVTVGIRLLRVRSQTASWGVFSIRSLGWIGLLISGCVLAQLHFAPAIALPAGVGGILGEWLTDVGMPVFGWIGLTLLCLTGVLTGAQAAAGFSWLNVAEMTGRGLLRLTTWLVACIDRRLDMWHRYLNSRTSTRQLTNARKTALTTEQTNRQTRPQPKIEVVDSTETKAALQGRLFDLKSTAELPDLDLLDERQPEDDRGYSDASLEAISRQLELKLKDFGVEAQVVSVLPGPVVTRFEVQPAAGVKVQKISSLVKDL
ncbi:MAG: DNA translocase FtsK 4TM domain-containing protein, partial [Gammaproteobacteria bacterium]|nr:DNA translocase FtsK 4TM domain-containing protein [Gammaproteobacteria bacterium]